MKWRRGLKDTTIELLDNLCGEEALAIAGRRCHALGTDRHAEYLGMGDAFRWAILLAGMERLTGIVIESKMATMRDYQRRCAKANDSTTGSYFVGYLNALSECKKFLGENG